MFAIYNALIIVDSSAHFALCFGQFRQQSKMIISYFIKLIVAAEKKEFKILPYNLFRMILNQVVCEHENLFIILTILVFWDILPLSR